MRTKRKKDVKGTEVIKRNDLPYVKRHGNQFTKVYTDAEIEKLADELLEWLEASEKHLWLKDFLITKRIASQRLSEFKNKSKYFDFVYSLCKDLQESKLFTAGTSKQNNVAMLIMALKAHHKWSDKQKLFPEDEEVTIHIGFGERDAETGEIRYTEDEDEDEN